VAALVGLDMDHAVSEGYPACENQSRGEQESAQQSRPAQMSLHHSAVNYLEQARAEESSLAYRIGSIARRCGAEGPQRRIVARFMPEIRLVGAAERATEGAAITGSRVDEGLVRIIAPHVVAAPTFVHDMIAAGDEAPRLPVLARCGWGRSISLHVRRPRRHVFPTTGPSVPVV
jgi:hypothetical protein